MARADEKDNTPPLREWIRVWSTLRITYIPKARFGEAKLEGAGTQQATAWRNPRIVDDDSDIRKGRKITRVIEILRELYPPLGKAPSSLSTGQVLNRVNAELSGRREPTVEWNTVDRARKSLD
jgi:hypothetical protein